MITTVKVIATMNEVEFSFEGDERAKSYALRIARAMVRLFDIPLSEAIGRINREWKKEKIFGPNQVYRRDPEEWARLSIMSLELIGG